MPSATAHDRSRAWIDDSPVSVMLPRRSSTSVGTQSRKITPSAASSSTARTSLPERHAIQSPVATMARNPPRLCVSATVMIVSATATCVHGFTHGSLRSEAPRYQSSGMFMTRPSAKSLLSSSMPPGPRLIARPADKMPKMPPFTPKKPSEIAIIHSIPRRRCFESTCPEVNSATTTIFRNSAKKSGSCTGPGLRHQIAERHQDGQHADRHRAEVPPSKRPAALLVGPPADDHHDADEERQPHRAHEAPTEVLRAHVGEPAEQQETDERPPEGARQHEQHDREDEEIAHAGSYAGAPSSSASTSRTTGGRRVGSA
jgi:hypothetical protein